MSKHQCPQCGCQFSEEILSEKPEKPFCPASPNGCDQTPPCHWPCKKLKEQSSGDNGNGN